jgi:hypothetical protein
MGYGGHFGALRLQGVQKEWRGPAFAGGNGMPGRSSAEVVNHRTGTHRE